MPATDEEGRAFARSFRAFLTWVHEDSHHGARQNEVVQLVREHLGPEGIERSVVVAELPPFDHVNLQVALDAWAVEPGRDVTIRGIATPPHYGSLSLQQLLHGDGLPPVRLSAPDLVDLPSGPGRTVACLKLALLMVDDAHGRFIVLVKSADPNEGRGLSIEIAGLATPVAQRLLRDLASSGPGTTSIAVSFWSSSPGRPRSRSPSPSCRRRCATTWCCPKRCSAGSSGTPWTSRPDGTISRWPASTSSAGCCCMAHQEPGRPTPRAT